MLIVHSFDSRFIALMGDLRRTYGERMFELEGIGAKDLDINHFSKQYYTSKAAAADTTIDSNANVEDTSVVTWEKEAPKPILKLNSLYMLWKDAEEKLGIKRANKMIEGEIAGWYRIHDLYKWLFPYCLSLDLEPLVSRGMPFYPKIKIGPIKHFYAFVNVVIQYVCFSSNHLAGAVSLPNLFPYMDYFLRKDEGENWHENEKVVSFVKQALQSFIYSLNFNYRSNQTAFTNISIYDDKWLDAMFAQHLNPDHSGPNFENIRRLQRMFVEEMVSNLKDNPFTFPVMTACMLYDRGNKKFHDQPFADWMAEVSKDTGLFNFYVDDSTASLSQCCRLRSNLNNVKDTRTDYTNTFGVGGVMVGCYDEHTEVLTDDGWKLFKDLNKGVDKILTLNKETDELEFHLPSDYISAPYSGKMHHYTHESLDMMVTPNHNMLTSDRYDGSLSLVHSDALSSRHNLPRGGFLLNRQSLETITIGSTTFKADPLFKLVGMYLGDGATYHDADEAKYRAYEISFQFKSTEKALHLIEVLNKLDMPYNVNYIKTREAFTYRLYSKDLWEFLQPCGKATSKFIPRRLLKEGGESNLSNLLEGLLCTDGYKKGDADRFCTSSPALKNSFEELVTLLGRSFHGYKERIRKPSWLKRSQRYITATKPSHEINILPAAPIQRLYKYRQIEQYNGTVYCVTVPNNTMFVRRNGTVMVSGNSHRVIALNLPGIAYQTTNWEEFKKELAWRIELTQDILDTHRAMLQKLIDQGRLPLYTYKFMFLKRQYSTVGFIGLHEAIMMLGHDILSKEGSAMAMEILDTINQMNAKRAEKTGNIYNLEQVPGEAAAANLALKDALQFKDKPAHTIYSNQYIPLSHTADLAERIKAQGMFDKSCQGGAILHVNVDEHLSARQVKKIMHTAAEKGVIYFAINLSLSKCASCGKVHTGRHDKSPCHSAPTIKYLRVVGYLTPVDSWGAARREEYKTRQFYAASAFN